MKISSNNYFTFCQNPGNLRLIIPLAAQFFSCVFLFLYPFLLSLILFPIPESALYLLPWSLPNPSGGHWSRTKEGKWQHLQPSPITVPCPCRLAASFTLISSPDCPALSSMCALTRARGFSGAPCFTARRSREWWLLCWGGGRWTPRALPPQIQAAGTVTQHLLLLQLVFPTRWLPFSSNEGSSLFSQNFKVFL